MKIYFDGVDFSSRTGPCTFGLRLAKQLFNMGHHVVEAQDDYDVALVFIEATRNLNLKKPFVQRLDGIWMAPDEYRVGRNANIQATYAHANHVVFQSLFDKQLVASLWGSPKYSSVITNGINIAEANKVALSGFSRADLTPLRKEFKKLYVCSANWHPQKRLCDNIRLFRHLQDLMDEKSCLVILGNNPDVQVSSPDVFYAGSLDHEQCLAVYAQADWMLHLAWLDHCPNVVVEALSVGTPVICTDEGGTCELVGGYGLVIKDVGVYKGGLVQYDAPPTLDVKQVKLLPSKDVLSTHADIDITHIAQSYVEIFESVL
jgi:glycosyltransferase involved in cell wall biosynthesis